MSVASMTRSTATLVLLTLLLHSRALNPGAPSSAMNTTQMAAAATEQARRFSIIRRILITEYVAFHKKHREQHQRLVVRFTRPQPGIGDRFTALFYAYISAALSNRILLIDWRHPFAINRLFLSNSGARFFYTPSDARLEQRRTFVDCEQSCMAGNLSMLRGNAWTVVENRPIPLHVRDIADLGRKHARDFEQARQLVELWGDGGRIGEEGMPGDEVVFSEIFVTLLRMSPEFKGFVQKQTGGLLKRRYVAVHARLGKGVSESGTRFGAQERWGRYAECLGRRAVRMGMRLGGDGSLFLASDSPEFRRVFRRAVAKIEKGWVRGVVYGGWETKHLARMMSRNRTDWELFQLSIVEFVLLGRGVGLVSGQSRFASAGRLVGGVEEREVVRIEEC